MGGGGESRLQWKTLECQHPLQTKGQLQKPLPSPP